MNVFGRMVIILSLLLTSLALLPNQQPAQAHSIQTLSANTVDFSIAPELQAQLEQVHTLVGG